MVASGTLGHATGEWIAIEPPPGDYLTCTVGAASVLVFESTVEDAERDGPHLVVEMTGGTLTFSPMP